MNIILASPLEQFQIVPIIPIYLGNYNFSITNSVFISSLGIFGFFFLLYSLINKTNFYFFMPNRWQILVEMFYEVIAGLLIKDIVGLKGEVYFPYFFSIFFFILVSNLIGLIPYSFTITSQLIVTFSLAFFLFLGINIICIKIHKFFFFSLFLPAGSSITLAFVLVPIEIVSYFVRPISLSVRLFANMMAGHTLLKVIAGFAWSMMSYGKNSLFIMHFIPLLILVVVMGLEFGVALIQAYVFTILTCIYLNDAINLH
mmetsp:Transcript_25936/g.79837  ORF Transcript_25936/g.79837 Transcript_25936/m.79837 type:complete len:257 (-) Transcript_25936:309-1079(-)